MTRKIRIGNVFIGGGEKIAIQSMTTTKTQDVGATVAQINELAEAGCDIVRVTVPDMEAARSVDSIKEKISVPLVADIHFDYRIALECIERGIDKIRINPGNIGDRENVRRVARAANLKNIPIRIGVNSGSVDKKILEKYKAPTAEAMVESALNEIEILNSCDFDNIVVSIKSSDVKRTVEAYTMMSQRTDFPLHIGVTEAGSEYSGLIKSSVGLGSLLLGGTGDTIRVSLTAEPVKEVYAAKQILKACGMYSGGIEIVSCPTCGRCNYNLIEIVGRLEDKVRSIDKNLKIAVMGCVVNGPGEAKEADFGIAGGKDECIFFSGGEVKRKIPFERVIDEIMEEIDRR